jgi:histidyl-tRNA synthetase
MEQAGAAMPAASVPTVYIAGMDAACRQKAFALAMELRQNGVRVETDLMDRSVKAQFKYADKIGAKYVAVIGGNELAEGKANVKCMKDSTNETVAFEDMVTYFQGK